MTRHAIWQMLSAPTPDKRQASCQRNKSVYLVAGRGAMVTAPVKSVPQALEPQTAISWIHCELEHDFVHKIAGEIEYQRDTDLPFNSDPHDPTIEMIIGLLAAELDAGGATGTVYADSLAHALVVRILLLAHLPKPAVAPVHGVPSLPPHALKRVKDHIEAELGDALSLDRLADESGYSRTHFLRMFRNATGLTPHQYVLDRRVRRAQSLIQQNRAPLAEVAFESPFDNATALAV